MHKHIVRICGILLGLALSAASCALGDRTGSSGWYSVSYEANGGTGAMENSIFTTSTPGKLRKNAFTLEDHTFMGWAKAASGPAAYMDEVTFPNPCTREGSVILYAVWARYPGFVWVEKGTFQMGIPASAGGTQQTITLTKGFYMAQYQETEKSWEAVMNDNPNSSSNLPVDGISWYAAVEYCNKLSEKDGLTPAYKIEKGLYPNYERTWTVTRVPYVDGYRLPTEAQWEYAARGGAEGSKTYYTYAGSNTVDDVAWYGGNSGNKTHEVGTKAYNALGIYDMSGNVGEWCWDLYDQEGDGTPAAGLQGPSAGGEHVLRGGGSGSSAAEVSSGNRGYSQDPEGGIRLIRP